jgi:hypothetical protein
VELCRTMPLAPPSEKLRQGMVQYTLMTINNSPKYGAQDGPLLRTRKLKLYLTV